MELMAVLAVIAVMTAMILPEMRGTFDDALLRSTARKLISACQAAGSRAIASNQPQHLRLETAPGRYFLESSSAIGEPPANGPSSPNRAPVDGLIDPRVAIELREPPSAEGETDRTDSPSERPSRSGSRVVTFYPDGTAAGPEIVLRDRAGIRLALRLHPITARVRLIELPRE